MQTGDRKVLPLSAMSVTDDLPVLISDNDAAVLSDMPIARHPDYGVIDIPLESRSVIGCLHKAAVFEPDTGVFA